MVRLVPRILSQRGSAARKREHHPHLEYGQLQQFRAMAITGCYRPMTTREVVGEGRGGGEPVGECSGCQMMAGQRVGSRWQAIEATHERACAIRSSRLGPEGASRR